jgi:ribosomal protein S6--L-glutamate ligase
MMHIVVLSRMPRSYSTRRLVKTAKKRGHKVRVADPLDFVPVMSRHAPTLYYKDRPVDDVDLVIPRIGASMTNYGLAVVRQLDMMGIPVLNNAVAIARSRDKLRAMQLLTLKDIDVPVTVCAKHPAELDVALDLVGGPPVIVKLLQGTQGVGVMIAETKEAAKALLQTLWGMDQDLILQQYIGESKGKDLRVIVVGGRVVAAMRRSAKKGEFRANLHRGGKGRKVRLSEEAERVAILATKIMALEIAGVDLLESKDGPKVLEVNSSPGLEGIEKVTGVDVADAIIAHAESYAKRRRGKGPGAFPGKKDRVVADEQRFPNGRSGST